MLLFIILRENCLLEPYIVVLGVIQMLVRGKVMAWEAEVDEWCVQSVENRLKLSLLFLVSEFSIQAFLLLLVSTLASFTFCSFHKICSV